MGQFKPMVKMETTEPSVVLKLKKGGSATFARMKSEGAKEGFKPVKKMDGGAMGALSRTPTPTTAVTNPTAIRAMAERRAAQAPAVPPGLGGAIPGRGAEMGRRPDTTTPPMRPPRAVPGEVTIMPVARKNGGSMNMSAKLAKHASMPASKAHKGLKTGGVVKGQAGFKTGGVVNGQAGFKNGGGVSKIDSGRPVAMPKKAPSKPVAVAQLAGTFKKGGKVC